MLLLVEAQGLLFRTLALKRFLCAPVRLFLNLPALCLFTKLALFLFLAALLFV